MVENRLEFSEIITKLSREQQAAVTEKNQNDTIFYLKLRAYTKKVMDEIQYAIFWSEALDAALLAKTTQFNPKKEGVLQLSWALYCQNYIAAEALLKQGVPVNADHEDALSFAIERTDHTKAFSPIKHFGLTLGIDTTIQGVRSQRSHIQHPFNLLCDQLSHYTQQLPKQDHATSAFLDIEKSYRYTQQAAQWVGSRPAADLGSKLAERYRSGQLTVVPCGWKGHVISVSVVGDKLILTNRGELGDRQHGTQVYQITAPERLDARFFQTLASGVYQGTTPSTILNTIGAVIDSEPVMKIKAHRQKRENCTYANPKSNIEGMLSVLMLQQAPHLTQTDALTFAHNEYKKMTGTFKYDLARDLLDRYQKSYGTERSIYEGLIKSYLQEHHAASVQGGSKQAIFELLASSLECDLGSKGYSYRRKKS